jgi:hypothetical protein
VVSQANYVRGFRCGSSTSTQMNISYLPNRDAQNTDDEFDRRTAEDCPRSLQEAMGSGRDSCSISRFSGKS